MMMRGILNTRTMNRSPGLAGGIAPAALLLTLVGCAQVKPQVDFAQARQLFTQSTGLADLYDPDQPLLTLEELEAVMADGLTLQEALRVALLNNRSLHSEFMSIGIAKADWVQSGLLSNPSLAFSAQFPEGGGRSNLQASIAQNIVDLWQIPKRKAVAQAELERTILQIARIAGVLATETKVAYFQAVAAEESLAIARQNLELVQKSYETVKAQREAGTVSMLDENLARGRVLSSELAVRNARLSMANAKRRLARNMSLARNVDDLILVDSLSGEIREPPSSEELIDLARRSRLDLRAMQMAIEASAARLGLERLKVFPEISIGPFGERGERRAFSGRPGQSLAERRSDRQAARSEEIDFILGPALVMTLPIFDQNQAQIAMAGYLYQQALKTYEGAYLQIAQNIRIAADRAETARSNAGYYAIQLVPQAERNLEFATASYSTGQTGILTLLEAQRFLLEARRGYIAVRLEASTALSELEQRVGIPLGLTCSPKPDPVLMRVPAAR